MVCWLSRHNWGTCGGGLLVEFNIVRYRLPVNFHLASFPSRETLGTRLPLHVHVQCWPQILEGDLCGLVEVQKWGQLSTGTL